MERCDRCGEEVAARHSCLGRRLCPRCVGVVYTLTRDYQALRDVAISDVADVVRRATGVTPSDPQRCARCLSAGLIFPEFGNPLCEVCTRELHLKD
ncbi:MAG TPA: hypothetical protein VFL12_08515 [Thermoanaerobaculia bacterium]|nr:hypothetical protein [Thermoanaerobaculia bacterium]